MSKNVVLIITNSDDPHADHLLPLIQGKGAEVIRFNTELFPVSVDSSIDFEDEIKGSLMVSGETLELNRIKSVWYRRPIDAVPDEAIGDAAVRDFIVRESREYTESLWFQIDALWVNHPYLLKRASRKIEQLKIARNIGWDIPPTLVTNDVVRASQFIRRHKRVIVKSLNVQFTKVAGKVKSLFAHVLTPEDSGILQEVKLSPCIFQQEISKKLELRITVIGNNVFVASVNSQAREDTKVDWRKGSVADVKWMPFAIPQAIIDKSLAIVRKFDLHFATIDVILTLDGKYVFLDLNPNGQWLWIELETGMSMANQFAELLVNHCK